MKAEELSGAHRWKLIRITAGEFVLQGWVTSIEHTSDYVEETTISDKEPKRKPINDRVEIEIEGDGLYGALPQCTVTVRPETEVEVLRG